MILLVEDDPPSGRAMALALKTAGHDVMSANNGAEALDLVALHDFELVVTDLVMPNLHGLHLINAIRFKRPKLPIILVSGYLPDEAGKAIVDKMSAFLQKPVSPTALLMAVERVLSKTKP